MTSPKSPCCKGGLIHQSHKLYRDSRFPSLNCSVKHPFEDADEQSSDIREWSKVEKNKEESRKDRKSIADRKSLNSIN